MMDATTPTIIEMPLVVATDRVDSPFAATISLREITVNDMQPIIPDLYSVVSNSHDSIRVCLQDGYFVCIYTSWATSGR